MANFTEARTIESVMTQAVRDYARAGGIDSRHITITFREADTDVHPVEIKVRMRDSSGRKTWAEGFGDTVWAAAAMAFAHVEQMKVADWVVGDSAR